MWSRANHVFVIARRLQRAVGMYVGRIICYSHAMASNIEKLPEIDLGLYGDPAATRVVVAMSGGVDSSVAAALVRRAGYETIGITLQLYDHGQALARKGACCAGQDIMDARQVAASLDIPHYVLDYESKFKDSVMNDFADSYLAGHTPVPCIRCNETVKFRDLLETARELGATALVTGHYIGSRQGEGGWEMYRPHDLSRDQSYFLFSTTQEQLDFLRFPLAHFSKDEIRAFAETIGLQVAQKPDSQDICFVPNGDYATVIKKLRPDTSLPGNIVDMDGEVLATHQGVLHYTVGQRRGLGIAAGEPLYVVAIDAAKREVIVGPREALLRAELMLSDVNWLGEGQEADIMARIRSTGEPVPARLQLDAAGGARVHLTQAEAGVSPGQACVFYDVNLDRVLGGGWIISTQ